MGYLNALFAQHTHEQQPNTFFFSSPYCLSMFFQSTLKRHTSTVLAIVASLAPSICFNAMSKQGGHLSYLKKLPVCTQCAKKRKGTKIAFLHILQYPYRSVCEHTILTFIAHKKRLTFEILPVLPLGLGKFTLLKEFQLTTSLCSKLYVNKPSIALTKCMEEG